MRKYFLIALAVLLFAGCQKNSQNNAQKPSISWKDNEDFSEMEITTEMHSTVSLSVPEGVSSFQISLSIPSTLVGIANKMIGISTNKGTASKSPVFDLVNDATAVSALTKLGFLHGNPAVGTEFILNFAYLVSELYSGSILDNASKFVFAISLKDKADQNLSKTVRFNWTSAPSIVFDPVGRIVDLNADSPALVMNISAPGKIAKASMKFSNLAGAPNADTEGILAYIKSFTKNGFEVDLIENAAAARGLDLPYGSQVKDQTQLTIDCSDLLFALSLQACDKDIETVITIFVQDALGKSVQEYVNLKH